MVSVIGEIDHIGEKMSFSTNDAEKTLYPHIKVQIGTYLSLYIKVNLMDHGPQHKTRYHKPDRRENREYTWTHCHRKGLSEQDMNNTGIKIQQWVGAHEAKNFCTANDPIIRAKWQPTEWETSLLIIHLVED